VDQFGYLRLSKKVAILREANPEASTCRSGSERSEPLDIVRPGRAGMRRVPVRDCFRGASRQKSSSTIRWILRALGEA
jgi:hypothetical protein